MISTALNQSYKVNMIKGNIFNIQKFSIHDGPGIRTTVFFKGCPLRCAWCSNPESQESRVQITYDPKTCIGCGSCIEICPQKAISHSSLGDLYEGNQNEDNQNARELKIHIDDSLCVGCRSCVGSCPGKALKSEGEQKTVSEVVKICLQDMDFYEESDGGVTLSGGECLCQPEFVSSLIHELKSHSIHVAAETTGYIDTEVFRKVAPLFDLLLFDVKHHDSNKHQQGTGVRNELIISNLAWAVKNGIEVLPRIPVIPGFNSTQSDAESLADLLVSVGIKRVQLLPFHQMGERKYELLGREYELSKVKALHPEDLTAYRDVFLGKGLDCFF